MQQRNRSAPILTASKRNFLFCRLFETLTGGFSLLDQTKASICLQIAFYCLPTLVMVLPAIFLDFIVAGNVAGAIAVGIFWGKKLLAKLMENMFSKRIFPANSNQKDISSQNKSKENPVLFMIITILIYGEFLLTTLFFWSTYHDPNKDSQILRLVLICVVLSTSSASFFLNLPKEIGSNLPNDLSFDLFTCSYMRPVYVILVLIAQIIYTNSSSFEIDIPGIVFFSLLPAWSCGLLGGIFNTFLWGLETFNALLFGETAKGNNFRTIWSFFLNSGIALLGALALYYKVDEAALLYYLLICFLSFVKCFLVWPIKSCFHYSDDFVVWITFFLSILIEILGVCLGLNRTFLLENFYFDENYQKILIIFGSIAAILSFIHWIFSLTNRYVFLKIFVNPIKYSNNEYTHKIKVFYKICQVFLCLFLLLSSFAKSITFEKNYFQMLVWSCFLIRSFNLCWFFHLKLMVLLLEVIFLRN